MEKFVKEIEVRWSDLDPNIHVRHSIYYDYGALCRIAFFEKSGLSLAEMDKQQVGVVLFREECVFKREIRHGDKVSVDMEVLRARRDFSRWTIRHTMIKNDDTIAAILTVEGAWLDRKLRKLTAAPAIVSEIFSVAHRAAEFEWQD